MLFISSRVTKWPILVITMMIDSVFRDQDNLTSRVALGLEFNSNITQKIDAVSSKFSFAPHLSGLLLYFITFRNRIEREGGFEGGRKVS